MSVGQCTALTLVGDLKKIKKTFPAGIICVKDKAAQRRQQATTTAAAAGHSWTTNQNSTVKGGINPPTPPDPTPDKSVMQQRSHLLVQTPTTPVPSFSRPAKEISLRYHNTPAFCWKPQQPRSRSSQIVMGGDDQMLRKKEGKSTNK